MMHLPTPPLAGLSPLPSPSPSCKPSFISSLSRLPTDPESSRSSWSSDSDSDWEDDNLDIDHDFDEDWWDDWPLDWDGKGLLQRLVEAESCTEHAPVSLPLFRLNVRDLLDEVEKFAGAQVTDIPVVGKGANFFGMHLVLENAQNLLARIARIDINWLTYDDKDELVNQQISDVEFESAVYRLLVQYPNIKAANLLYSRPPRYSNNIGTTPSGDVQGRALFLFHKTEGVNNVWPLDPLQRLALLDRCAEIRGALFGLDLPNNFVESWTALRLPWTNLDGIQITPTRSFTLALLTRKLEEVIPDANECPHVGPERDGVAMVGPKALAAKVSLKQLISMILPDDKEDHLGLYRLVLEHGDYGIHNMSIVEEESETLVTSLYDWESGHIIPALLSNPQLAVYVDLQLDNESQPTISRIWEGITEEAHAEQLGYAKYYYDALQRHHPQYFSILKQARDARHIWTALISFGEGVDDHELYFGRLGNWAEEALYRLRSVDI
ncbi:hypothetical protein MIND_01292800 [Mycena indigotica]|uniref:Aminoglycoside phosphotransferase domain-containing protein n=1 Tax=Mycena indigotica TaxID=2126181 RepID=A0A8H6VW91_9AGAR|nr:uncharacterized protein MIND_01292800 [Mycena indigotica]KAF7290529.1 hypothetical protein MIND_01292800 [Mycena indigotica]